MPHIRTIKPGFFIDERVCKLKPLARLFFIGLWCQADKAGRMKYRPWELGLQIVPVEMGRTKPETLTDELEAAGLVVRYESGGEKLLWVVGFEEHQRPHPTERESELPAFNGELPVRPQLTTSDITLGREGKGREGNIIPPYPPTGGETGSKTKPNNGNSANRPQTPQDGFDAFWAAYPNRTHKPAALKAWCALARQGFEPAKIMAGLKPWLGCDQWTRDDGRFIPHPATFLNQHQFNDSPVSVSARPKPNPYRTGELERIKANEVLAALDKPGGTA